MPYEFSFVLLLNSYRWCLNNYDSWDKAKQYDQIEACWCEEIGGAQRQMPAWFIYVFSEEGTDEA